MEIQSIRPFFVIFARIIYLVNCQLLTDKHFSLTSTIWSRAFSDVYGLA
mgnify:CR=1 FL=1